MRADSNRLALILAIVAAALAFIAAIIRYVEDGEVRWGLIAAAVFLLAFGFSAKSRTPRE